MRVIFQPVLYDKEDDHDKNRNENTPVSETVDCDSRRKKSIVITLVSSHISIFVKLAETDLKLTIHFNSNQIFQRSYLVKIVKKRFLSETQQLDSSISGSAETLSMRAFSSISTYCMLWIL